MKKLVLVALFVLPCLAFAQSKTDFIYSESDTNYLAQISASQAINSDSPVTKDCKCQGKVLKGKVKIVNSFPNFKVKVVSAFEDLKVKSVSSFPDDCGEWQFVDSFPDFTIQFVDSFPDFTIKFVDAFPGVK